MRIVCIHIPYVSLQALARTDVRAGQHGAEPRTDAPVAVAGAVRGASGMQPALVIVGCNRAAYAHGVRAGMAVSVARTLDPSIMIEPADPKADEQLIDAVADVLLGLSPVVDRGAAVGAHHALYAALPARSRGESFGAKVLTALEAIGVRGRIGIADDKFTAWAAAAHAHHHHAQSDDGKQRITDDSVVSVPRGGSAAFLAPLPVAILGIAPEVEAMLHELHVNTVGEFARLPAPSVARPLAIDYQALARGEGSAELRSYQPAAKRGVVEAARLGDTVLATVELLAERVQRRLDGRGRRATELQLRLGRGDAVRTTVVPVPDDLAQRGAPGLIEAISRSLPQAIASIGTWMWLDVVADRAADDEGDDEETAAPRVTPSATMPPVLLTEPVLVTEVAKVTDSFFQLELAPAARDYDLKPRRSRRGKHRPRVGPPAQGRLFRTQD